MNDVASVLRPWSFEKHDQPSIRALLDRVNRERGHFRDINTSALQEEVATEGALTLSDSDDGYSDERAESATPDDTAATARITTRREDLYRVKQEMLEKVSYAHNEIMMALDFASLLASKDSPAGRQTMSQFLKENVPPGTLGSDLWKSSPPDPVQEAQNLRLAQAVRTDALKKSADTILAAAKSLESSVQAEVNYWNQINTITTKGWNLYRLPGSQNRLGVRFGFTESAPRFSQAGTAPLEVSKHGEIMLPPSVNSRSRFMRTSIYREGVITGQYKPSIVFDLEPGSLESSIREARDSVFDEELFYEMERESRSLLAYGVRAFENTLSIPLDEGEDVRVHFELIARSTVLDSGELSSGTDSAFARSLLCVAGLLLCRAHQQSYHRRTQSPPPLADRASDRPLFHIVRPVMAYLSLNSTMSLLNARLNEIENLLELAGLNVTTALLQFRFPATDISMDMQELSSLLLIRPLSCVSTMQLETTRATTVLKLTLTVRKDMLEDSHPAFCLQLLDKPDIVVTTYQQALTALDRQIAILVAAYLAEESPSSWKSDDRVADLTREVTDDTQGCRRYEASVVIESRPAQPALRLIWTDGSHRWTSEEHQQSLLDVWKTVPGNQ